MNHKEGVIKKTTQSVVLLVTVVLHMLVCDLVL